jgi:hypothetical protein
MTARTWIGGKSNNQVTDPSNFSPMGAPEPGDDLTITSGTMNISGRQLPASDVLNVGGDATVNIRNGVEDHLTVGGTAHVNLTNSVSATIYKVVGNISINTTGTNHLDLFTPGRGFNGSVYIQNSGTLIGRLGGFSSNYTWMAGGSTTSNRQLDSTVRSRSSTPMSSAVACSIWVRFMHPSASWNS